LSFQENLLELQIFDNGFGFDDSTLTQSDGFGIYWLRERGRLMGGTLFYNSEKGKGTRIYLTVPL